MQNTKKIVIFLLPALLVLAGLIVNFVLLNNPRHPKKDTGAEFVFDYEKIESLGRNHPAGEKFLGRIRDAGKFLSDNDGSNDAEAYLAIAFNLRKLGDNEMAIGAYKEALKINSQDPLTLNNIATSYRDLARYKEAEEAYSKLIAIAPGEEPAYRNLAEVYAVQHPDDEDGVKKIIESGLGVVLEPAALLSFLAGYYRDRGNIEKAVEYFGSLLKLYPDNDLYTKELEELKGKL